jgi:hypothetical protein
LAYACMDGGNVGPSYITLNTTLATPSPAASDYHMLAQPIEGLKVNDFQWGAASARQVVLRFDALPTVAGTIGVSLRAGDNSRSYVKNVALTAGGWNTYTVVIPGDIAGTWATDNSVGMTLYFALMSGSTYIGVEGWQAGAKIGAAGMSNSVATASQPVFFRNVGLYLDPQATGVAPPFQIPDYAQELAACMRYYQLFGRSNGARLGLGQAYAATIADILIPLSPPMRVAPAFAYSSALQLITPGGGTVAPSALASGGSTRAWMGVIGCTLPAGSGMSAGLATQLATTDANGAVVFSARM